MAIKDKYPTTRPSLDLNFAGSKTVDPRITFTRASTATYYDGKTFAKAEENLWLPSAQVPTTGSVLVTTTQNATTAPDGKQTAGLVVPTTDSGLHAGFSKTAGVVNADLVFSFYAKPAGYDKVRVGDLYAARLYATFDLASGTVSETGGTALRGFGVVDAGNGWKRCWIKFNTPSAQNAAALVATPFPTGGTVDAFGRFNGAGDGTSGVYFWGFQLEQRSSLTAYTPTTDQPITRYQPVLLTAPAGTPRIDHDPVTGECKGLLIEEQRTNMVSRSEAFTAASWLKSGFNIYADQTVAPDGTLSADLVEFSDVGQVSSNGSTATVAGAHTFSFFIKPYAGLTGTSQFLIRNSSTSTNLVIATLTWSSMTVSNNASITALTNGWYRLSVTATSGISVGDSILGYIIIGGFAGLKFFLWGAQLEDGAFPTSYIKTEASQVTRAADNANMTGTNFSSWYRQDEGSIVTEFSPIGISATDRYQWRIFGDANLSTSNGHSLRTFSGVAVSDTYNSTALQSQLNFGSVPLTGTKIACAYKTNDFIGNKDGAAAITDTIGTVPTDLHTLLLPSSGCNHIKRIAYYPKRLSNTQLQAMTL